MVLIFTKYRLNLRGVRSRVQGGLYALTVVRWELSSPIVIEKLNVNSLNEIIWTIVLLNWMFYIGLIPITSRCYIKHRVRKYFNDKHCLIFILSVIISPNSKIIYWNEIIKHRGSLMINAVPPFTLIVIQYKSKSFFLVHFILLLEKLSGPWRNKFEN